VIACGVGTIRKCRSTGLRKLFPFARTSLTFELGFSEQRRETMQVSINPFEDFGHPQSAKRRDPHETSICPSFDC
jgi:hypothetical protein